jgi:hypothetical protein
MAEIFGLLAQVARAMMGGSGIGTKCNLGRKRWGRNRVRGMTSWIWNKMGSKQGPRQMYLPLGLPESELRVGETQ